MVGAEWTTRVPVDRNKSRERLRPRSQVDKEETESRNGGLAYR